MLTVVLRVLLGHGRGAPNTKGQDSVTLRGYKWGFIARNQGMQGKSLKYTALYNQYTPRRTTEGLPPVEGQAVKLLSHVAPAKPRIREPSLP